AAPPAGRASDRAGCPAGGCPTGAPRRSSRPVWSRRAVPPQIRTRDGAVPAAPMLPAVALPRSGRTWPGAGPARSVRITTVRRSPPAVVHDLGEGAPVEIGRAAGREGW